MNRRCFLSSVAATVAVGCAGEHCPVTDGRDAGEHDREEVPERSDITDGQAGIPLTLSLRVQVGCDPLSEATVTIWQANAEGVYSGEGESFLRGSQTTDDAGECRFETIYPGFYEGRTSHIHVRVAASGYATLTTRLHFPRWVILAVAPEYPALDEYTTNLEDPDYSADLEVTIDGDATGYTAAFTLTLA